MISGDRRSGVDLLPKTTGFDDRLQIQQHQGCDPSFIAIVDGFIILDDVFEQRAMLGGLIGGIQKGQLLDLQLGILVLIVDDG